MKIDLEEQVVIVTGAGRGIGEATARLAAESGATVVVAARSEEQIEAVANTLEGEGHRAKAIATDVTDEAQCAALIKTTMDAFGRIDALVNNAGTNYVANLVMSKEEDWRQVYEVNLFGVFRLTKAVVRQMIRKKSGRIINIASTSGKVGAGYNTAYSSSKAAVIGFTRSVAIETAALGITANAICPWHVDTELLRFGMGKRGKIFGKSAEEYMEEIAAASPQKRILEAREVAAMAVFLMSHDARGITGQAINVCGGTLMGV